MISQLNFVRGAVAKKDLVPILTHLHCYNGRLQGSNGRITIDTYCKELEGMDFTVPMEPFLKAIDHCEGEPQFFIEDQRLRVKKGKLKITIPLSDHSQYPRAERESEGDPVNGKELFLVFKTLSDFMGEDAVYQWSCAIQIKDGKAYATNNVTLASMPLSFPMQDIIIPSFLVKEVLRVGAPIGIKITEKTITFDYPNRSWIKGQLLNIEWPNIEDIISAIPKDNLIATPSGFDEAIRKILPFCPDSKTPYIRIKGDKIATSEGDMTAEIDFDFGSDSMFRAEPLLIVLKHAKAIDLSQYPNPCPFRGDNGLEGLLVGLRI